MKSQDPRTVNYAEPRRKRRGLTCLLWAALAFASLLVAGAVVIGAVYAGWNAGLPTARAHSTHTAAAYARQQCERIPVDLAALNLELAQKRFDDLRKRGSPPACALTLAPGATAAFRRQIASPTPAPTASATPPPTIAPALPLARATPGSSSDIAYDLEALLTEARQALGLGDYPSAIDTLEAIISIDGDFQRDLVRASLQQALGAQALALYRGGRLSEAVVMTDRAEEYGSIDDLYHERYIALLYLDGQRYLSTNPAEAVRKFSQMYHEFGVRDYVNGSIATELQEAHRNLALALALGGDPCAALDQFEAALELRPSYSRVNLADLAARRDQSAQACYDERQASLATAGGAAETTPQGVGVRAPATPAPVGHSG